MSNLPDNELTANNGHSVRADQSDPSGRRLAEAAHEAGAVRVPADVPVSTIEIVLRVVGDFDQAREWWEGASRRLFDDGPVLEMESSVQFIEREQVGQ